MTGKKAGGENSPGPRPFSVRHQGNPGPPDAPIQVIKEGGGIRGEFTPPGILAIALALAWIASPASAQDGRAAFETRCASCHAIETSAPPGPGPNLAGLSGCRIAGDARFDYSPALQQASGAWTAERLAEFLDDPEEMFPGLWMGGNGVRDATTRRAIVDYLMR